MMIYEDEFSDLDDKDLFGDIEVETYKGFGDYAIRRRIMNFGGSMGSSPIYTFINLYYKLYNTFAAEQNDDNYNITHDDFLYDTKSVRSIKQCKVILFDILDDMDDEIEISTDNFLDNILDLMRKRGANIDQLYNTNIAAITGISNQ